MKRFFKKLILTAMLVSSLTVSLVFSSGNPTVPIITVPENRKELVCSNWVYIDERKSFMHVNLYSDGSAEPTRDKSFDSVFNQVPGHYATDQEGFMIKGYVFKNNQLYYFSPSGNEVGRLLFNATIRYKGKDHQIDEFGRIQGDLSDFFANAHIYTMGLYQGY